MTEQLRVLTQAEFDADTMRDILALGLATVVFDGLDEIGQLEDRRFTVAAIQTFCRRYPLVRVMVTSRQEGYVGARLDSILFPVYQLPDFTNDQVELYVRRWFQLTATTRGYDAAKRAAGFLDDSTHVIDLRNNPLMLSLLCLLYEYEGYIPENRPAVYEQCAELLFERWDRIRGIRLRYQPTSHVRYLVQELAYHFLIQRPEGGETEQRLKSMIGTYFERNIVANIETAVTQAEEFLDYCSGRAWLLTQIRVSDRGERQFGFTHRTFMEYFAACFIVRQCDSAAELVARISPMITDGASDVVPQIAIQQFDLRRADGINECMRILVCRRQGSASTDDDQALLLFGLRSLRFIRPSPAVVGEVYREALRVVGARLDLDLLVLLFQEPLDTVDLLARTWQAAIKDVNADPELRLGTGLASVLAKDQDAATFLTGKADIQTMLMASENELRQLALSAPDIIAAMRHRRLVPRLHKFN